MFPELEEPNQQIHNLESPTPLAENSFLFEEEPQQVRDCKVKLFCHEITIESQINLNNKFRLEFDFDTTFSVLKNNQNEEEEKTDSGIPYGIMFEKYSNQISIISYDHPALIRTWCQLLSKFLNQKKFHQIFQPIKKIGKGTFASVYLVNKHEDQKLYAVKAFAKEDEFEDDRGKEALINEIKIMRNLDHKNLMNLKSVFETENSIYLVMEYLGGGLLYEKIQQRHAFTGEQVHEIMKSILNGLLAMHDKRIMHRDIKPENILFRNENSFECVIADFGLATFCDMEEYIFTRCGTPGYVAPEISNLKDKNNYEPICDIFSVGVIFHIIALGTSPFPGREVDEVLKQNRECSINFGDELYKRIRASWLDLMQRMLEKDPSKRITALEALEHEFFCESNTMEEEMSFPCKYEEVGSPLMITKNPHRKRNLKLRDDSCLKFKMKENIHLHDEEEVEKINSPLRKRISRLPFDKRTKTICPSNFKM